MLRDSKKFIGVTSIRSRNKWTIREGERPAYCAAIEKANPSSTESFPSSSYLSDNDFTLHLD
jgi:hypothetical protein